MHKKNAQACDSITGHISMFNTKMENESNTMTHPQHDKLGDKEGDHGTQHSSFTCAVK